MVRWIVVLACGVVICGAPLADALCYAGCSNRDAAGAHHSCASENNDATALSAAPHKCTDGDDTLSQNLELRHTFVAVPPLLVARFDSRCPIVTVADAAHRRPSDASPQLPTPLRI